MQKDLQNIHHIVDNKHAKNMDNSFVMGEKVI